MSLKQQIQDLRDLRDEDLISILKYSKKRKLDIEKNPGEFVEACKSDAKNSVEQAQFILAKLLWLGMAVKRNPSEALVWAKEAAENKSVSAIILLSNIYELGFDGLEPDRKKALEYLEKAAKMGSTRAMNLLSAAYFEGIGVAKNELRAIELLETAASLSDSDAQYSLGVILSEDLTDSDKMDSGFDLIKKSAENLNPLGHNRLDYIYRFGWGNVPKDQEKARYHSEMYEKLTKRWPEDLI